MPDPRSSHRPGLPAQVQHGRTLRASRHHSVPNLRRRWRQIPPRVLSRWLLKIAIKALRAGCIVATIFGVASAIYLTDRRSSDIETIRWLPNSLHNIAHWADYHGRFRNVPAYALLALPTLILLRTRASRARGILILALFAMVMEYTQLFIPTRFFEWQDITESWVGLVATWSLVEAAHSTLKRLIGLKKARHAPMGSQASAASSPRPIRISPHSSNGRHR